VIRSIAVFAALVVAVPAFAQDQVTVQSTVQPDGTTIIAHEVVVPAPTADVWSAISTAEGWRTWTVPLAWPSASASNVIETSQVPGATRGHRENIRHEFLAAIPGRVLVFRTIGWPSNFHAGPALADVRWVFELSDAGSGTTRVRLTGTGFSPNRMAVEARDFFLQINRQSLDNLRRRFISGPMNWGARFQAS
jgi:uncharacterized protein YndB with AHSA1/START domain